MLREDAIEQNMRLYLQKMEEKHQETSEKLIQLEKKLHDSARKIQKRFRMFILMKKTRAAMKIQRLYRKHCQKRVEKTEKMKRFRVMYFSYKIYYFLQRTVRKNKSKSMRKGLPKSEKNILKKVRSQSHQYSIALSVFLSELSYIRKYQAYDRKSFFQKWETYEKKQRQWIWEQIRKKWVRKQGQLWINQQQKEVNAEKYVSSLIEQTYNKHYQSFQESQRRLNGHEKNLKIKMEGLKKSYLFSLLFGGQNKKV